MQAQDICRAPAAALQISSKRLTCLVKDTVKDETGNGIIYKVKVADWSSDVNGVELLVRHEDIWNDPSETFSKSVAGILYAVAGADIVGVTDALIGIAAKRGGAGGAALDFASEQLHYF